MVFAHSLTDEELMLQAKYQKLKKKVSVIDGDNGT